MTSTYGAYIMLCLISIVELYSASSREISATNIYAPLLRHMMHLGIGFFIIISLQRIHYRKFYFATPWIVLISILAMVYTLINGEYVNGARRSFSIIIMSVQPAEFLKFLAVLLVAYILCRSSKSVDPKDGTLAGDSNMCRLYRVVWRDAFFTRSYQHLAAHGNQHVHDACRCCQGEAPAVIIMIFGILGGLGYMYKKATLDDKPDTEMICRCACHGG